MDPVTVKKTDLLETLRRNRDEHRDLFLKAQKAYRKRWIKELERKLKEARNNEEIVQAIALPVPEDHTDDFDTVIQMLEWDQNDTLEISYRDFLTYVRNDWGWKVSFAANTESYLAEQS